MNLYRFIEAEKTQQRNVKRVCELLEVSRAAYYANRADSPSTRPRFRTRRGSCSQGRCAGGCR